MPIWTIYMKVPVKRVFCNLVFCTACTSKLIVGLIPSQFRSTKAYLPSLTALFNTHPKYHRF